ncbi:MAG: hypothetical protein JOZ21_15120 [Verrucomicrobia bacterium]|nr:hypothetical protein [Verrucomicrobiota bacterium]
MRGSPLLRAVLVVLALLALLAPLRTLTNRRSEAAPSLQQAAQSSAAKKKIRLELTSTTAPFKYQITSGGQPIWSGESDSPIAATDLELEFPPEGIDLVLDASWVEQKLTAVRLALTPQGSDTMAKTIWGTTNVSEVLTFQQEK